MTAIHPHTYMHTYTHTYTQQQCSPENLFVYIKLSYNKVTTPQYSFVFLFLVVRSKCYKNPNIPIHPIQRTLTHPNILSFGLFIWFFYRLHHIFHQTLYKVFLYLSICLGREQFVALQCYCIFSVTFVVVWKSLLLKFNHMPYNNPRAYLIGNYKYIEVKGGKLGYTFKVSP